jgi:hypothetical protein
VKFSECESEIQHILFVLDTSGSIGQANFETVTRILGGLTTLFCDRNKIAVMTFDHEYYVEFSFDRYRDDHIGRIDAGNDIESIPSVGNKKSAHQLKGSQIYHPLAPIFNINLLKWHKSAI